MVFRFWRTYEDPTTTKTPSLAEVEANTRDEAIQKFCTEYGLRLAQVEGEPVWCETREKGLTMIGGFLGKLIANGFDWGSLLGGIIGALGAYYAAVMTLNRQKKEREPDIKVQVVCIVNKLQKMALRKTVLK